jgi:serine/threonine-protein kinase
MIGQSVGGYTVVRQIGQGGMGAVYLAEHRRIQRRAALKVLLPEYCGNQQLLARFFAEASAASRIRHPGITEVLDCDVLPDGQAYILMELLEGESLRQALARAPALGGDIPQALAIAAQVAEAMDAAHRVQIVHRDLKPDNVFLVSSPERPARVVKVLDFGIAKLTERGGHSATDTSTGMILGTPIYMSPEQCRGTRQVDSRTDIYSLGCVLFEMLCGRPPFQSHGAGELIAAHIGQPAPSARSLAPGLTPAVDDFVAALLEKEPERRPQTMRDVADDLMALASGRGARRGGTVRVPAGQGAPSVAPVLPATLRLETPGPDQARHRPPFPGGPNASGGGWTTFSATAGESVALRPRRSRSLAWVLVGAAAALGAGGLYLALASGGHAGRTVSGGSIPVAVPPPVTVRQPMLPPPAPEPAPLPEVPAPEEAAPSAPAPAREANAVPARRPHRQRSAAQPARVNRQPEPPAPRPPAPGAQPKKRLDAIEDI